ncbi:MAG: NAD(P)H-dependent oxidoreductase [Chromatiales bacterium]|nr:NAD(P)H-dependent oxidoreductase [Chromatiales bacterium]
MKRVLRIDASARITGSHTRQLADHYQTLWLSENPEGEIIHRDLAQKPIPHLTNDMIEAFQQPYSEAALLSNILIEELKLADHLLISSPLYNLTLPSTLKAYFDHVVRAGQTFLVQQEQYIGLLNNTSATIITARGGLSQNKVNDDFQTNYLKEILNFIGITAIEVVELEGTALVPTEKARHFENAKHKIDQLFQKEHKPIWHGKFSTEERATLDALREQQAKAITAGDAHSYAALCTDDIILMIPGHDIISGKEHFLNAEQNLFSRASFSSFQKYPEKIERCGDMAIETGRQEITMTTTTNEGGVFSHRQKYMHVFRLTESGWRYASLMSNQSE